jgi:hypothetical protein
LKKKIVSILVFFTVISLCFADLNYKDVPESAEIRQKIAESWLFAPFYSVREKNEEFIENRIGTIFQIRMEESDDEFSIVVAPRSELDIDMMNGETHNLVRAAVYPRGGWGSWVLVRDKKNGKAKRAEFHFNHDADVYLVLRPDGNKTYADILVYGSYLAQGVPLGVSFERLHGYSFRQIIDLTKKTLPWQKVNVTTGLYRDSVLMAATIRSDLKSIIFTEDACYDEFGRLKSITTGKDFSMHDAYGNEFAPDDSRNLLLSGAGFLKWIVDGIVEPMTGFGTKISDLTSPTVEFNSVGKVGVLSQEWNFTFTLDWCRNLSSKVYSVNSRRNADYKTASLDVTHNYFSSAEKNGTIVKSTGYTKNTGYEVEQMRSIFYVLAVTEPSWFYLGAIRQSSVIRPDELVFNNCAVFFPYFDDNGKFGCFVFEQGKEISLEDFVQKYKGAYLHLSRVKSTDSFFPYEKK